MYHLLLVFSVLIFLLLFKISRTSDISLKQKEIASIIGLLVSFLTPLSWLILAKGHTTAHPHLIPTIWYLPFIIIGSGFVGYTISRLSNASKQ